MKKTFRLLGMAMVAVLLSAGFAACDNDDDDDYFNPVGFDRIDDALLGTWQYTSSGNGWSDTETITFYSDGTYYETDVETAIMVDRGLLPKSGLQPAHASRPTAEELKVHGRRVAGTRTSPPIR